MAEDKTQGGGIIVWTVLGLWLIAFVGAFVAFWLTPSEDFGLAAGWNKVGVFMMWQTVASTLAVIAPIIARRLPKGSGLKKLSFVPLGFLALLAAAFAALLLWASYGQPEPEPYAPPGPVTQPAPEAVTPEN